MCGQEDEEAGRMRIAMRISELDWMLWVGMPLESGIGRERRYQSRLGMMVWTNLACVTGDGIES